ncbi:hypothetical protein CCACVL1_08886 [Corchorus capsularis]|uniref:Uncharacterized protein n=1 Tax=Corchorus capsularis TaxID=210143 RepID=A0A1R3IYE9_COCAP|nr:hypothetical protein CCACVL1_08886 [Corchorus capsularis]
MDSDEDLELLSPSDEPSSPVHERKLKRLKKVKSIAEVPPLFESPDFDIPDGQAIEEPKSGSRSGFEGSDEENESSSGFDDWPVEENVSGSVAKRTLDFDSLTEEVEGNVEDQSREMEIRDSEMDESGKKRPSFDGLENKEKKKKKKRVKGVGEDEMPVLPERRTAKERREYLAQLHAESQRLLRETRDAAFRPAPLVQKPISSVLEKIRRRKLEISKKTYFVDDDHDGFSSKDMVEPEFQDVADKGRDNDRALEVGRDNDHAIEVESPKANANHGISDTLPADGIKNVADMSSSEELSTEMTVDKEPKQAFRAPLDDTQDLFSDSQTSDSKDEFAEETPGNSLKGVLAPSLLALNLKLDSAPPDDISSDEEDNDKENIEPQPHGSVDLSSTPNGDPVRAFVDEEAEEEADSDDDKRFEDDENEEDEDAEDLEDIIETGYEEEQSDVERRMELHQKLFDQQDASKTENLLRRWGMKQSKTTLIDEERSEEESETDDEEDVETTEDLPPINLRMHVKKIKEMIPQMFTDKDDMYISSDDEEAEKKLVEQCLSEKANQRAELLPPTKDARSKELFGYIKKVNNMPDTRRKAKPSSFSNMLLMGKKGSVSSKSSFIGRGSNCPVPSSRKQGSGILRSFVFEREDSNSRSTTSIAENSSDVVQREHRPTKTPSAKFKSSKVDDRDSVDSSRSGFGIKDEINQPKYVGKSVKEVEAKDGERGRAVSVTKYSPFWSERFQFMSAVKLNSVATCINVLPFRDFEGLSKYVAVGDERGRVYVFLRNGDVVTEFHTKLESPIMAMVSYMSTYKNESVVVTGHQNGMILVHRIYEGLNGEESGSPVMETVGKFVPAESGEDGLPITTLEVHHVGRMRYILSADLSGKIRVFREDGTLYGSAMPTSRPLLFLKQRLLFLTETGAGSLDLRNMKIKESDCEGLNHSLARTYVFDPTERSKAYGFTSDGDLIHVLLLGDVMNFKCRVRSKKKLEMHEPLAFQAIKGYLLIVDPEKVFVYNVSTQHYVRVGAPRFLFSAGLDEIRSSFLIYQMMDTSNEKTQAIPLIASDREKLVVLGLGGEYVGMYRSNLPVSKGESSTMLWTSPVLFFILFLFGAWQFFAKKKEALTSWGPDDPFISSTTATNGAPLGSSTADRSLLDSSSRGADIADLRSSGLRGRRYPSPSRYPGGGATSSFRPNSADPSSRPAPVDPNYRAAPELKYRGSALESSGFPKRRESLFVNSQVVDDNS